MESINLRVEECVMTGELGFMLEGVAQEEDYDIEVSAMHDGRGVAHDIVEHHMIGASIGGVFSELMALGAVWHVRGQHADLSRDKYAGFFSPEHSLGTDVAGLWEKQQGSMDYVPEIEDEDLEKEIGYIISAAREQISVEDDDCQDSLNEFLHGATRIIMQGYKEAEKKFGNSMDANRLFWNIAEAVEGLHRECEGQEFMLRYSLESGEVDCEEIYEGEWE